MLTFVKHVNIVITLRKVNEYFLKESSLHLGVAKRKDSLS